MHCVRAKLGLREEELKNLGQAWHNGQTEVTRP